MDGDLGVGVEMDDLVVVILLQWCRPSSESSAVKKMVEDDQCMPKLGPQQREIGR